MTPPDRQRYEELARKWLEGNITPEEQEEFSAWYNRDQDKPAVIPPASSESETEHREKIWSEIRQETSTHRSFGWWKRGIAAAALALTAGYGIVLLTGENNSRPEKPDATVTVISDVPPGGDKATLTFDDGLSVSLDEQQNGILKDDRGVRISKKDGMVVYETTGVHQEETRYNVITTPRGGQYSLRLPDGSTVWLNAASSIRYPTRFTGQSRAVELRGEAFFDIVPSVDTDPSNPGKIPFIVTIPGKQTVKVLGTQFNISSYEDELSVRTTLVEGSVEVLAPKGESTRLKPNQQSTLSENGKLSVIDQVDMEEALAWKNGQIIFKDTDIKDIMRQIARWYDVDVVYRDDIPVRLFNGGISRDSKLSSILKILETSGIRFTLDGKKIIVTL